MGAKYVYSKEVSCDFQDVMIDCGTITFEPEDAMFPHLECKSGFYCWTISTAQTNENHGVGGAYCSCDYDRLSCNGIAIDWNHFRRSPDLSFLEGKTCCNTTITENNNTKTTCYTVEKGSSTDFVLSPKSVVVIGTPTLIIGFGSGLCVTASGALALCKIKSWYANSNNSDRENTQGTMCEKIRSKKQKNASMNSLDEEQSSDSTNLTSSCCSDFSTATTKSDTNTNTENSTEFSGEFSSEYLTESVGTDIED